jgi:putative Holliday junction resolvase
MLASLRANAWLLQTTLQNRLPVPARGRTHKINLLAAESTVTSSASMLGTLVNETKLGRYQSLLDAAAAATHASYKLIGTRTLGVDFGLVRTGIATSVGYQPKPLAILTDLNTTQVCQQIVQYARAEQASQVIVGLPLHKNGTVAEQTNITLAFAEELTRSVLATLGPAVPVILWDERYTSKEAAARAHAKHPGRSLYGTLDAEAACIILEHYYNENGQGALLLELDDSTRQNCLDKFQLTLADATLQIEQLTNERNARLQRRNEMMARRQVEEDMREGTDGKRKKKKKRKR